MTRQEAVNATYRQTLYHRIVKNKDGSALRCRVNGKCKTWKTHPQDFRLPIKHGFNGFGYIDQDNADNWSIG